MRKRLWYLTTVAAFALLVITFSPLVTPAGRHTPGLFGFPYTLWTGMIISVGLVILTIVAANLSRGSKKDDYE